MFLNISFEKVKPSYPSILVSFFRSSLSGSEVLQNDIAALTMGFMEGTRDSTDDPAREDRTCNNVAVV